MNFEYGEEIVLPTPQKKGYTFIGWSFSEENNNGSADIITSSVWKNKKDVTIYARWQIINYSVNYTYNYPNTNNTTPTNVSSYTIDDTKTNAIALNSPLCEGYTFEGWYDNANYTRTPYTTISIGSVGSKHFYAKWEAKTYIVALNDGSNPSVLPEVSLTFDEIINIEKPSKVGNYFDGWYDNPNYQGNPYWSGQSEWDIADEDVILYAKWHLESYKVKVQTFDTATNTTVWKWWDENGLYTEEVSIEFGLEVSFYSYFRNYFRNDGFRLGHYCSEFIADSPYFNNKYSTSMADLGENGVEVEVVPIWIKEQHTINFSGGGGTLSHTNDTDYFGNSINFPTANKVGHIFNGWKITYSPNINNNLSPLAVNKSFNQTTMPDITPYNYSISKEGNSNITITAQWIVKKSTISFNSNGGSSCNNLTNVLFGSSLTNISTPTKTGYTFMGWYADQNFTVGPYKNGNIWDQDINGATSPTIYLYAKWDQTIYSVSFDEDGGTTTENITYDIETETFDLPIIHRDGFENLGWINVTNNNIITKVEKGSIGNLSLRAKWHNDVPVGYNVNSEIDEAYALLDFSSLNENINSIYKFADSVKIVYIKGDSTKSYTNLRFEINSRYTSITIKLLDMEFSAQTSNHAIFFGGGQDIIIHSYGNSNKIIGGDISSNSNITSAIKASSAKVIIQGENNAKLILQGGSGKSYTTLGNNGLNGGIGITANSIHVSIDSLTVYGGDGGDGGDGTDGGNGSNGANAPASGGGQDNAKGRNGTSGKNGTNAGKGGNGNYALSVNTLTIGSNCDVNAYGGDGGDGGNGGDGGDGGNGGNGRNAQFLVYSGAGGNGGNGGNSGDGGNGGNGCEAINITNASVDTTEGYPGNGGSKGIIGNGGTGGSGGKFLNSDTYQPDGADGSNGTPGDNGTDGTGRERSSGSSCVGLGTLITLADGSQIAVENLIGDEMLLVWNLFTGTFDVAPILFIDSDPFATYEIIEVTFSDGTIVKVIDEHGFWNFDLNKYVFIRDNASQYIGDWFKKQTIDSNGNIIWTEVQLVDVNIYHEQTTVWSPVTYGHLCYYVNGMLSMPGGTTGLINIFDVEAETMTIDMEAYNADIAEYGLFTYEEFAEIFPVSEMVFEAFNGQYLKVAIGKGILTYEMIGELLETYSEFLG